MRKLRRGKDINITVILMTHWQFVSLEDRELKVFMVSPTGIRIPIEFRTYGCKIRYTFDKNIQDTLGKYYVSVYERMDDKEVLRIDDHFLFELTDDPDYDTLGEEYNIVTGGYDDIEILDEVSVKNLLLQLKSLMEEIKEGNYGGGADTTDIWEAIQKLQERMDELTDHVKVSVNEEQQALIITT